MCSTCIARNVPSASSAIDTSASSAARVRRGHEVLVAVLRPLHRTAEQARRERERGLLAPHVDLLAERAADVGHDHVHLRDGKPEDVREVVPGAVRALARDPDRHVAAAGIPARDRAAGLHRHRDVAVLADRLGHDVGGGRRTPRRARGRRATWWCGPRWSRARRAPTRCRCRPRATGRSTAGRGSYSMSTSSHASSASARLSATTRTTGSPTKHTTSRASGRLPSGPAFKAASSAAAARSSKV